MDNLEAFVNDLLNDKLEPYLKSEPVPEDNSGGVKVRLSPFVVFKITKCYNIDNLLLCLITNINTVVIHPSYVCGV